jgi:hypothetical protein
MSTDQRKYIKNKWDAESLPSAITTADSEKGLQATHKRSGTNMTAMPKYDVLHKVIPCAHVIPILATMFRLLNRHGLAKLSGAIEFLSGLGRMSTVEVFDKCEALRCLGVIVVGAINVA